ncbi:hypothetical protein B0H67DRAFT_373126 [Lasiosphaeris hirsuta]|uniref:Uncharacterized protein n=1 Tax=Lasiosphaeris hirsuta TaxID=260670 RepID=A0AA39ZWY3_9PEZI|nr:hypothetical protein B0H67DRAFT_373126 [Lasiosphaeris hirsuta]
MMRRASPWSNGRRLVWASFTFAWDLVNKAHCEALVTTEYRALVPCTIRVINIQIKNLRYLLFYPEDLCCLIFPPRYVCPISKIATFTPPPIAITYVHSCGLKRENTTI